MSPRSKVEARCAPIFDRSATEFDRDRRSRRGDRRTTHIEHCNNPAGEGNRWFLDRGQRLVGLPGPPPRAKRVSRRALGSATEAVGLWGRDLGSSDGRGRSAGGARVGLWGRGTSHGARSSSGGATGAAGGAEGRPLGRGRDEKAPEGASELRATSPRGSWCPPRASPCGCA